MPSTGSKSQKLSTSLRDCKSIQRIDGSTASRANTARSCSALGCSAAPGAIEPSVSSTSGGPRRPTSGSSSSARVITAGASAPPPLWPMTMISSASFGTHRRDDALRAGFDRGIEAGRLPARELAQIGPVVVDLDDEPAVGERPQREEDRQRRDDADETAGRAGHAEVARQRERDQPSAADRKREPPDQHQLEMDQRETELPGRAQHPDDRAADEIVEGPGERARHLPRATARPCWRG